MSPVVVEALTGPYDVRVTLDDASFYMSTEVAQELMVGLSCVLLPPSMGVLTTIVDPKTCPACEKTGPVGAMFGFRNMGDGTIRSQSHCKSCR